MRDLFLSMIIINAIMITIIIINIIIKSPPSGVTVCFQFVSAKTFASHVKTVCDKSYIFGTKNIWVFENVLDDLSVTLTQDYGCDVD